MLALRDLHKSFGPVVALDGLTLELRRGEVFGLLGPNGAGKTTTLGITTGLVRADRGQAVVLDESGAELGPTSEPSVRRCMGLCPQANAVYERLSGRENVVLFARVQGMGRREAGKAADRVLERVGLGERADHAAGTYSGGMLRRLNVAMAIVHRPKLVLLDEPTAGVDPHSRQHIRELIAELRAGGATVLLTTHDMDEAERVSDRVGVVDQGKLRAVGTVDELIAAHGGASRVRVERASGVTVTEPSDPVAAIAGIDLRPDAADPVRAVHVERPDLESVFLNLTGRSLRDG